MSDENREKVLKILPSYMAKAMSAAIDNEKLVVVTILTKAIIDELMSGRSIMMNLGDGGVIILVPQPLLDMVYGNGE